MSYVSRRGSLAWSSVVLRDAAAGNRAQNPPAFAGHATDVHGATIAIIGHCFFISRAFGIVFHFLRSSLGPGSGLVSFSGS